MCAPAARGPLKAFPLRGRCRACEADEVETPCAHPLAMGELGLPFEGTGGQSETERAEKPFPAPPPARTRPKPPSCRLFNIYTLFISPAFFH